MRSLKSLELHFLLVDHSERIFALGLVSFHQQELGDQPDGRELLKHSGWHLPPVVNVLWFVNKALRNLPDKDTVKLFLNSLLQSSAPVIVEQQVDEEADDG